MKSHQRYCNTDQLIYLRELAMARIAFFPFAEIGHTNATFGLARRLRARGHDVFYLSLADVQDHVRSQGWEFTPFFEDVFPKGYLDAKYALLRARNASLRDRYAAATELAVMSLVVLLGMTLISPRRTDAR